MKNEKEIYWERTGDILSKDSFYTHNEELNGYVGDELVYTAIGIIDGDEIVEIEEIEKIN